MCTSPKDEPHWTYNLTQYEALLLVFAINKFTIELQQIFVNINKAQSQ